MVLGTPIVLNLIPSGARAVAHVNEIDQGAELQFAIYNGNTAYNVPEGVTATVRGTKGDGFGYTAAAAVTVGSNIITVTLDEQMTAVAGVNNVFELVLANSNGFRAGTSNFILDVERAALNENTVISDSDIAYAEQVLNDLQSVQAVNTQVQQNKAGLAAEISNRQAAVSAEASARQSADQTLQQNINAEATARQAADNTLQSNINAEASTRATTDASLQSQIDQLVAPSGEAPSAAEVENARIGSDGTVYPTLGDAIRTQNSLLKSQINLVISETSGSGQSPNNFIYPLNVSAGDTIKITTGAGGLSFWTHSNGLLTNTQYDVESIGYIGPNTVTEFVATAAANYLRVYYGTNSSFTAENISKQLPVLRKQVEENADNIDSNTDSIDNLNTALNAGKNLLTAINTGKYYEAWNTGDTATVQTNDQYACGYADVTGIASITVNVSISTSFSFFADSSGKRVAAIGTKQGTGNVYAVPSGAERVYISTNFKSQWSIYGIVVLSGTADIATDPVSDTEYPYNTVVYFADNLRLSNGETIGDLADRGSKTFYIKKDGTGDFTSFVDGITEACKHMGAIVYVGAGTYDLLDELGETYVSGASSSQMGLVLKNRVHVICSSRTVLQMKYTGTANNVREYLSAINAGDYGFTLENATIETENVRYAIHDDRGNHGPIPYHNKYINCTVKHHNGFYHDCIGGGIGENGEIEIRGCYFESDANVQRIVYYHGNNNPEVTDAKCRITVTDNYFANVGTFKMTKYGQSQEVSIAYVSNNSFGSAPSVNTGSVAPYDNVAIVAWNNEIRS